MWATFYEGSGDLLESSSLWHVVLVYRNVRLGSWVCSQMIHKDNPCKEEGCTLRWARISVSR